MLLWNDLFESPVTTLHSRYPVGSLRTSYLTEIATCCNRRYPDHFSSTIDRFLRIEGLRLACSVKQPLPVSWLGVPGNLDLRALMFTHTLFYTICWDTLLQVSLSDVAALMYPPQVVGVIVSWISVDVVDFLYARFMAESADAHLGPSDKCLGHLVGLWGEASAIVSLTQVKFSVDHSHSQLR